MMNATITNYLIKTMDRKDLVDALDWYLFKRTGFEKGSTAEAKRYLKERVRKHRRERKAAT